MGITSFVSGFGDLPNSLGGPLGDFGDMYAGIPDYEPTDPFKFPKPPREDEELARELAARGEQTKLNAAITDRAMGRGGPSVAELQQRAGVQQASSAAMGLAASARGSNRALAQRGAQSAQANIAADAASKGAMLRAQEQIAAQGLASQNWQAQRMADLQARGLSSQQAAAELQAEVARMQARTTAESQEAERGQKAAGGILTAVGGLISDMRAKENVSPIGSTYGEQLAQSVSAMPVQAGPPQGMGYRDPYALDASMMPGQPQTNPYGPNPYQQPQPQQQQGGGGMDLGAALQGAGGILSDRRAKERAFREGAAVGYAGAASSLFSPLAVPAAASMAEQLAKAVPGQPMRKARISSRSPEPAPAPAPVAAIPPPGYAPAAMIPPPGYSIPSDRRVKDENERLKDDLDAMGRALTAQISGQPPTARFDDVADSTRRSLAPVNPYEFSYKPEAAARYGEDTAPRTGVMAQELLKSPAYAPVVERGPDGMLTLDPNKLNAANTAMIAGQDKRLARDEALLAQALEAIGNKNELKIRRPNKNQKAAPRSDRFSDYLQDAR